MNFIFFLFVDQSVFLSQKSFTVTILFKLQNVNPNHSGEKQYVPAVNSDPEFLQQCLHVDEQKEVNLSFRACFYFNKLLQSTVPVEHGAWLAFAAPSTAK